MTPQAARLRLARDYREGDRMAATAARRAQGSPEKASSRRRAVLAWLGIGERLAPDGPTPAGMTRQIAGTTTR